VVSLICRARLGAADFFVWVEAEVDYVP